MGHRNHTHSDGNDAADDHRDLGAGYRTGAGAAALEQRALAYRLKSEGFDSLVEAAQRLRTTRAPLNPERRIELLEELRASRAEHQRVFGPFQLLTDRERATLHALGRGSSVHEIAKDWVVSEATVRTHVRGVLTKLNAPSQLAAVASALRSGWLAQQDKTVSQK